MKLLCSIYCDISPNKLKLCLHDLKLPVLSQNVNSSSKTSVLPLLVDLVKCTYSLSKCMPYEVKIHGIEVCNVLKNSLYSNLPLNPWSSLKNGNFFVFHCFYQLWEYARKIHKISCPRKIVVPFSNMKFWKILFKTFLSYLYS